MPELVNFEKSKFYLSPPIEKSVFVSALSRNQPHFTLEYHNDRGAGGLIADEMGITKRRPEKEIIPETRIHRKGETHRYRKISFFLVNASHGAR